MSLETVPGRQGREQTSLSTRLRTSALPLWQRQFIHPFVVALGDGSLPQANFEFYIRQDALFLDVLTKTFAYAVTRTGNAAEMEQLGKYLLHTLQVEEELHRHYARQFGVTPEEMAATPMAPTNYAYTRHLLAIAATETLPAIITAILPCAWIYAEVGQYIHHSTPPTPEHPYFDWLATYASPDFDAVGNWLRACLDNYAPHLTSQEETHLQEIFLLGVRYEWLFWEMAWRQEQWPA